MKKIWNWKTIKHMLKNLRFWSYSLANYSNFSNKHSKKKNNILHFEEHLINFWIWVFFFSLFSLPKLQEWQDVFSFINLNNWRMQIVSHGNTFLYFLFCFHNFQCWICLKVGNKANYFLFCLLPHVWFGNGSSNYMT